MKRDKCKKSIQKLKSQASEISAMLEFYFQHVKANVKSSDPLKLEKKIKEGNA